MNISIIITAMNNGKYLAEAIESCLNQTVKPCEVIYSDDYSTDNSLEIARNYPIKVVAHKKHLGVVKARNSGADKSKGDVLLFMDGDDKLTPDFLERHLEVFDKSTPFTYCAAQAFGELNCLWRVKAWGTQFLWNQNFVNTCALMWKDAFVKVGKWQETCENTMWDWSLALRLSRLGTPRKSPAILLYRQHGESWSHSKEKTEHNNGYARIIDNIRRELVNLSIGLIYSGRLNILDKWMDCLVDDIKILNNKPQLIVVNNSEKPLSLKKYEKYFTEIKIITGRGKITFTDERDRRNKVCEMLSEQYNMILENSTGELIHLREDDILPDNGSFKKIFDFVTKGRPVKEAVAGVYLNRNIKRIVGGFYNESEPKKTIDLQEAPKEPFVIDFTGTGFIIFWKGVCPMYSPKIDGIQAHDWAWSLKLKKMGGKLWMIPSATCKHYQTETEYVEYSPHIEISPVNTFTKKIETVVKPNVIVKQALNAR